MDENGLASRIIKMRSVAGTILAAAVFLMVCPLSMASAELGPASDSEQSPRDDVAELRTFEGDCLPGSFIELYTNGQLAGAQSAGANNHYVFADIAIHYGKNRVNIRIHDLHSHYEERDQFIEIPSPPSVSKAVALLQTDTDRQPAAATPADDQPIVFNVSIATDPLEDAPLGNDIRLAIVDNRTTLGTVAAYIDRQNTYVSLHDILRIIGMPYSRYPDIDSAEISLSYDKKIFLDFRNNLYRTEGRSVTFFTYDLYHKQDEIYVNTEWLNRVLPDLGFVVDLSLQQIAVSVFDQQLKLLSDIAPAPFASPVQPVFTDNTANLNPPANEQPAPEASDVLHMSIPENNGEGNVPEPNPQERTALPEEAKKEEDESLILQPIIKGLPPNDIFIEALKRNGQTYLPLNDLLQIFAFPIKYSKETESFSGFYISSENTFRLDLKQKQVQISKGSASINEYEVFVRDGQIYINAARFAEWFGINSDVDTSRMTIHFTTEATLPQEEEAERQKRWQTLIRSTQKTEEDYPVVQNPYKAFGYPAFDVNLGSFYNHAGSSAASGQALQSNLNVQGAGDLGYLTSKLFLQGSVNSGGLDTLRFMAGRVDPNAQQLGGMQATEFEMGDVTSPSLTLVTSNSLGRGVMVTNRAVNASENFDYRNFFGDAVPGYQVELYRNDVLLAFQTVDATGRYNFQNIPILFGENIFRIVLYGQQGQREERVETVSASGALLKENQFSYALGLDQRGESLLPVTKNNLADPLNPIGLQGVGNFRYGLSREVTLGAALAETQLQDGAHQYLQSSADANILGVLTEADFAQDINHNSWAASTSALGGFEGVSLRLRYRKFNNFVSEAINNTTMPLTSDTSLDANTQFLLPVLGSYSMGLSALHENFVDPSLEPRNTYSWRSSKNLWGISFTNSVDYVTGQDRMWENTFGVQTRLLNTDLRATGITDMEPQERLREVSFTANYRLDEKLSAQTSYDKILLNDLETYSQNINWDFDAFRLSFTGQTTNQNSFSVGLNLIFSVNHDPVTGSWRTQPRATSDSGAAAGRVYVADGAIQPGEDRPNFTEAKVKVNKLLVVPNDNDFYSAPVAPYQVNRVELVPESIKDPLLSPETKGYQVVTRPGDSVVVDFPLFHTTIIDGTVFFIDEKGEKQVLSEVPVELDDHDGKALNRVISGIDGYFMFDKVRAGDYTLTVPDEALTAINARLEKTVPVKIDKIDEFMTGNEILLRQNQKFDTPPPDLVPPATAPTPSSGEVVPNTYPMTPIK
jgi:hypothetical protein